MSDFSFYLGQIIDGIAFGCIYGLFALAVVFQYRANKIFNFAQTEISTLCVVMMWILLKHTSFWPALLITLIGSFCFGCLLHILVLRFVTERREAFNLNQAVITFGLFIIFSNVSSYIMGDEAQAFPSLFSENKFELFGVHISYQSIGTICVTGFIVSAIYIFFRFTKLGLKFEAISENLTAARLKGIRVSNILAISWGLATLLGAFGAVVIAPVLYLSPSMLSSIFGYSLIAVVIGGLESPFGAVVGGILIGVVENLSSNLGFVGSELKFVVVVILLILFLIFRPRGIWGRAETRRV